MGLEADCTAHLAGKTPVAGRAFLETTELIFKQGARRHSIALQDVKAAQAKAGWLEVTHRTGIARFELGQAAEKWALRIRYPRSRIDKLGVKPGSRVAVIGLDDREFEKEIRSRTADVAAKAKPESDLIFVFMKEKKEIDRLRALRSAIKPEGGIWVVWPKGRKEFREDDVRAAGPALGLVDVKVVSFSDTLSGLKMVIPVAQRPKKKASAVKR